MWPLYGQGPVSVSLFTLKWVQRCMYTFDWMEPAICLIMIQNCFGCILFHRFEPFHAGISLQPTGKEVSDYTPSIWNIFFWCMPPISLIAELNLKQMCIKPKWTADRMLLAHQYLCSCWTITFSVAYHRSQKSIREAYDECFMQTDTREVREVHIAYRNQHCLMDAPFLCKNARLDTHSEACGTIQ